MPLGSFDRNDNLARLGTGTFDVLVIGGGITGAGVALDAAARGLRTALVERDDFASGTSSKSSKLVHGGLRYLQNGDVRLVYEALHERQRLLRNAPHLVKVLPFLIPVFTGKGGIIPKQVARALGSAMWMYDLTGGLRIGKVHRRLQGRGRPGPHADARASAWPGPTSTTTPRPTTPASRSPSPAPRRSTSAPRSSTTRRSPACVKTADRVDRGRRSTPATAARSRSGPGSSSTPPGVWADDVRALDEGTHPHSIRPAKGIHITVPWEKVRNDIAAVVPVPKDRRSVFVVPWPGADGTLGGEGSVTYIGTTDTDYDGDVDDPQCTPEDVAYLLDAINRSRPRAARPRRRARAPGPGCGRWSATPPAAARPTCPAATGCTTSRGRHGHRHRRQAHHLPRDGRGRGRRRRGRLGGRRRAAPPPAGRSRTRKLPLRGRRGLGPRPAPPTRHLAERYGGESGVLAAMVAADPALGEPLVPGLPYRRVEALYAARYEMATTLDDVLVPAHPRPAAGPRRHGRGRRRRRRARRRRAGLVRGRAGRRRSPRYRAAAAREREVPGPARVGRARRRRHDGSAPLDAEYLTAPPLDTAAAIGGLPGRARPAAGLARRARRRHRRPAQPPAGLDGRARGDPPRRATPTPTSACIDGACAERSRPVRGRARGPGRRHRRRCAAAPRPSSWPTWPRRSIALEAAWARTTHEVWAHGFGRTHPAGELQPVRRPAVPPLARGRGAPCRPGPRLRARRRGRPPTSTPSCPATWPASRPGCRSTTAGACWRG